MGCKFDSDTVGGPFGFGPGEDSSGGSATEEEGSSSSAVSSMGGPETASATASSPETSTATSTPDEPTTSGIVPCDDGGGCDENATCDDSNGEAICVCNEGFWGDGGSCDPLELDTLRIELPCVGNGCGATGCNMAEEDHEMQSLVGDPDVVYEVTLRFRGVVEEKTYMGPGQDGLFHPDATPAGDGFNIFALEVDDPGATYFLNSGQSGVSACVLLDEEHTIQVRGGGSLRLRGDNGGDGCGVENQDRDGDPVVIPGIEPAPDWFDGQFVQVDVVAIETP